MYESNTHGGSPSGWRLAAAGSPGLVVGRVPVASLPEPDLVLGLPSVALLREAVEVFRIEVLFGEPSMAGRFVEAGWSLLFVVSDPLAEALTLRERGFG